MPKQQDQEEIIFIIPTINQDKTKTIQQALEALWTEAKQKLKAKEQQAFVEMMKNLVEKLNQDKPNYLAIAKDFLKDYASLKISAFDHPTLLALVLFNLVGATLVFSLTAGLGIYAAISLLDTLVLSTSLATVYCLGINYLLYQDGFFSPLENEVKTVASVLNAICLPESLVN